MALLVACLALFRHEKGSQPFGGSFWPLGIRGECKLRWPCAPPPPSSAMLLPDCTAGSSATSTFHDSLAIASVATRHVSLCRVHRSALVRTLVLRETRGFEFIVISVDAGQVRARGRVFGSPLAGLSWHASRDLRCGRAPNSAALAFADHSGPAAYVCVLVAPEPFPPKRYCLCSAGLRSGEGGVR